MVVFALAAMIGNLGRDGEPAVDWRSAHQAKVLPNTTSIKCPLTKFERVSLIQYSSQIDGIVILLEKFTYSFIKLSVLFFYRRIFIWRSFRVANSVLIAIITLWGLVFFLDEAIVEYDTHIDNAAESQKWSLFWFAITDVLGDIAILILPYPCIRKLQMGRQAKVGLTIVFLLGTL